jgi:putative transposase
MKDEEILRKQAIEMHAQGISIITIADRLGKTRQWVYKWLKRYEIGNDSWCQSFSTAPKTHVKSTSSEVEKTVVFIRKSLNEQKYSQKGALSILHELGRMNISPPSVVTINRILKRNNLLEKDKMREVKKKNILIILQTFNKWISLVLNILKEGFVITSLL